MKALTRACGWCLLLTISGCLDTLSVGLSTSAVLDAGLADDVLDASASDAETRAADASPVRADASDGASPDRDAGDAASDAASEPPEECPIARCAVAGILTPDTTPRCSDGGVALCLHEDRDNCGWSCEVVY